MGGFELLRQLFTGAAGDSAGSLAAALATLGAVAVYLRWALRHWPRRGVMLASCVLAVLLVGASALLLRLTAAWWPVWPSLVALAFGHLGAAAIRPARSPAASTSANVAAAGAVPVAAARSTRAPAAPSAPVPDRAQLGRYRIDRQIGRGAMGAVYLGHDPKIGRQVAIKTMALSREFEGDALLEARNRFFREAETAGRLQHPDIVTIFDAGEDQDLAYIAMEYLRGEDLQRHTAPGQLLPVATVLQIGARVADALAYAHSQGVVHRDIKPANVMVDLPGGTVKVTDFGIARITDSSRTRTGMILGTPSYMSPEQMAGHRVDGRSDLYSLGVMLFQLLTGQLPHRADSMARLMHDIANVPAPDIRTLRPDLPEALAHVVALALEKRPEVRYASGQQLAADLRAVAATMDGDVGSGAFAGAAAAPQADAYASTVRLERNDPRHNAGL